MLKIWEDKHFLKEARIVLSTMTIFVVFLFPTLFSNGSTFASNHSITINTGGDVDITILPDKSTTSASEINVTTTCRAGYNLSFSTSGNDNHLYLNGDSSNNSDDTYFNPSDGETILNNATNTWGYSLGTLNSSTLTPPTTGDVFLPVPTSNTIPAILKTTNETASDTTINDNFSIYYGVNAGSDLASGAYYMQNDEGTNNPGSIVYFVTMNPLCAIELDLSFNENLDGASQPWKIIPLI